MTLEELNSTPESKWILCTFREFYNKRKSSGSFSDQDFTYQERYINNCFKFHSRILDTCSQVEQVTIFLKRFDKNYYKANGIGQADFIQYHLEIYVSKLFTLIELLLQYTNTIYQLDLKPKQCNLENIKKKLDNNLQSIKVLDGFNANLRNWRAIRNKLVHENNFIKDEAFEKLSIEEFLWLQSERLNQEPEIDWIYVKPRHFVDKFLKQERKKKIELIHKNNL